MDPDSRQRVEFGDPAIEVIHPAPVLEFGDDGVLNVAEHRGIDRFLALVLALPNEIGELVDEFTQIHVFPPQAPLVFEIQASLRACDSGLGVIGSNIQLQFPAGSAHLLRRNPGGEEETFIQSAREETRACCWTNWSRPPIRWSG